MNKYFYAIKKAFEARNFNERVLLLGVLFVVLGYGWLVLVSDRLGAEKSALARQIAVADAQILDAQERMITVQASASEDPDAFVRARYAQVQNETNEIDMRLSNLYGQLISPQEMATVLTSVLQRETNLELIGLENVASQSMVQASASTGLLQVYRHGLKLEFEGEYLETIRYLKSLEELESNFFWETLTYELEEYPKGKITMSIFTLSTDEGWIGV